MVQLEGDTLNSLFDTLAEWNRYLKHENVELLQEVSESSQARLEGDSSNALFDILEDWNKVLKQEDIRPEKPEITRRGPLL